MRVVFEYNLGVPLKNPTTITKIRSTFPPVGRTEYEGLTETETRTLIFAELARLEREYGEVSTTVVETDT